MFRASNLVLVRANLSRPRGKWPDDVYDVWDGAAKVVGHILSAPQSPQDRPWFWAVTNRAPQQPTQRGYAASREAAMAEFRAAWEREP